MAINNAFEPDNNDERSTGTVDAKAEPIEQSGNRRTPNENTSFNVHLDTYFSDEKILIPEQVSDGDLFIVLFCTVF